MKLTIELVPQTCWYSNVRSNVTAKQWDVIRRKCYEKANHQCEICNGVGNKHPVECHEVWQYDDINHIQSLTGLIALCPSCHMVKHVGLSQMRGQMGLVVKQLMKVNGITQPQTLALIDDAFNEWANRSQYEWTLDISYLDTYVKE